jgi:hypothetical protein
VTARDGTAADSDSVCPVCGAAYDSLSVHEAGLMVNLLDNERYRRVCFDPAERDGVPVVEFYHHSHEQVAADAADHDRGVPDPEGVGPAERRENPVDPTDGE